MGTLRRTAVAVVAALAAVLLVTAPASAVRDTDKDGIPNKWEKKGKTPQGLNLKKLKANPKHKDLYIEFAYSKKTSPSKISCTALDALYDAFRKAPLNNPDGKTGVTLHLDAGKTCPSRSYNLGGVSRFTASSPCASPLDSANTVAEKRLRVFHLGAIVAESELCGAEGQATTTDFLVKDNGGGSFFSFVVLHELGHIFGLDHGPFNGFSVMSGGAIEYDSNGQEPNIDFLRYPVKGLNETALDENTGYRSTSAAGDSWLAKWYAPQFCGGSLNLVGPAAGPVDWNCSGSPFWVPPYSQYIDPDPVSYDVNGDGVIGTVPGVPAEWPRVNLRAGRLAP